ncbi:MAG: MarR family transcriptional regulator [Candidatus Aenigmatarchaeota archaeon]|nr:MAG: MarR family transcriptional regulator [Candidatus Aenigmarchaeota archaeon]
MRNRNVGFLIVAISALIGFIIYSFNRALTEIVSASCSHGESCPMWGTLNFQTNVSMAAMIFVAFIGVYLIVFGEEKPVSQSRSSGTVVKPKKKDYSQILADLDEEGRKVLNAIIDEDGTIFQSQLVEKTELSKVKMTRILDRLEGKGLVERKRRGMTNVVILKH